MTELTDLVAVDRADVYKRDHLAGWLTRTPDGVEFRYDDTYITSERRPVATSLPLSRPVQTTARPGAVPPFFAGLLPEGRRLTGLRNAVKTSLDDELSLLLAVGRDLVGDVRVVPHGTALSDPDELVVVQREWAEVSFGEVLEATGVVDPVGLAGVQDKASAKMISVPLARAGERYILKVSPPEYPGLVENEAFFLAAAGRAGLRSAIAELVADRTGRHGLLVRRFDRVPQGDGSTESLACEDACQVLGLWPEAKYRATAEEVCGALASVCAAEAVALRDLFRQLVFAWVSGNGDAHAKNFSVLADTTGEWFISPAYDLVSTAAYRDLSLAISVQGKKTGLSRRRFLAFGEAIGLSERAAERSLDDLLDRTASLADDVGAHPWTYTPDVVDRWVSELRFRHRQLRPS
jgi:serine/threonine-protein kinase HipA